MHVLQISDRRVFAQKAKGLTAEVTAMGTVQPGESTPTGIVMHPGLSLFYGIEFEDADLGLTRWTFVEFLKAGMDNIVSTEDTLLTLLRSDPNQVVKVRRRSGSVDV